MENLKNVAPIEDFNWDAYENGETVTNVSHEDLEKAYDNTLNKVNDREVVDGTVIAMNKREVVVNIGYKSDGIIPLNEFRYNPDLKVGDTVEVYIENQEDKKGQLVLSHRKARATRSWDRVNAALENEEIIKGYIKCRTKELLRWNPDCPVIRLSEIYYMLAECELRAGDRKTAAGLINQVRGRNFEGGEDPNPVTADNLDEYRMLDEWMIEFLGEGRRRTDLIRWDKFVTESWWDHTCLLYTSRCV